MGTMGKFLNSNALEVGKPQQQHATSVMWSWELCDAPGRAARNRFASEQSDTTETN